MSSEPITVEGTRCPVCGKGHLERRTITDRFACGGSTKARKGKKQITIVAENVPVEVCNHCQETFRGPEAGLIRHRALCRALGLLTPEEIVAIRERLGLSQAAFAKFTDIGEATISRWERGRLLQNKAMDRYLRFLDRYSDRLPDRLPLGAVQAVVLRLADANKPELREREKAFEIARVS